MHILTLETFRRKEKKAKKGNSKTYIIQFY